MSLTLTFLPINTPREESGSQATSFIQSESGGTQRTNVSELGTMAGVRNEVEELRNVRDLLVGEQKKLPRTHAVMRTSRIYDRQEVSLAVRLSSVELRPSSEDKDKLNLLGPGGYLGCPQ